MRKGNRIYGIIATLLLSLGACSLIHDDMEELGYREDGSAYAYVSLTIHTGTTGSATRANPTGGEAGDGYEDGQTYENAVSNLTLFFYPATLGDGGVNRTGDVDFTARIYIQNPASNGNMEDGTLPIDKTFTVGPVKVEGLKTNQQYHVLAVANAGDLTVQEKGIVSLDDLRKAKINQVYTYNPEQKAYSNFVMASEGDEDPVLDIKYDNSKDNPATTSIDLERLVARVDYQAIDPKGQPANDGIYEIDNVGTARITGALLVNTLKGTAENSFLFKRVTLENGATGGNFTWLGDETNDQNGAATNYVLDPLFTSKTGADQSSNYDNYFTGFNYANSNTWESLFIKGIDINGWKCVGYPKENTAVGASKYHTTGIVFKAAIMLNEKDKPVTFFEWKGKLYNKVEEIMQAFDPTNWNDRIAETNQWTTVSSWDDLRSIIIAHLKDDPAGYKDFLASMAEGKNGTIENKSVLSWSNYMKNYCFYEEKEGIVSVDIGTQDGKTRQILAEKAGNEGGGIRTYKDGICYYTYWIKHANNNEDGDDMPLGKGGIMEYGIVRNNVYKLNVTSISKVGDDIPGDRTLEISVSVKNWEVIEGEDEIELQPNTGE